MKRTIAVLCSAVLALSVAPFASATVGDSTTAPSAAAKVAPESQISIPTTGTESRDSKKACHKFCVSTNLPEAEIDTFFVNDNRYVLSVNIRSVSLYNLDTRRVTETTPAPPGFSFTQAFASEDADEVYVIGSDGESAHYVYRINLETAELVDVTPESSTYALSNYQFAVLPGNDGYIATVPNDGFLYLCRFSEVGVEIGCTTNVSGSGQATSGLYFRYSGYEVFMLGAVNKIFTFDLRDMTFTQATLTDFNFEIGETSYADAHIWVAEYNFDLSNVASTTLVKVSTESKEVVGTYEVPGKLRVFDILANPYEIYVLGKPYTSSGRAQKYSSLTYINLYPDFEITKVIQIAKPRRAQNGVSALSADVDARYVLAAGDSNPTAAIPFWGAIHKMSSEYDSEQGGWNLAWDFLNLQAGRSVSAYDIYVKGPNSRDRWVKSDSVAVGGDHVYRLTRATIGDRVKVVPRGVKGVSVYEDELAGPE